jgi:hypothetical protein
MELVPTAPLNGHRPANLAAELERATHEIEALTIERDSAHAARTAAERRTTGAEIQAWLYALLLAAMVVAYLFG